MAVVVNYDENGNPITRSLSGVGVSDSEREKAYKLDQLLQEEFLKLINELKLSKKMPKTSGKGKVEAYWELGNVLRRVFFESGLIEPVEKPLYWLNVELHIPKELLSKNRGANRIHVEYCFRLAGYPKAISLDRKWSEWSYLFDSSTINKESRFDKWDEYKIENEPEYAKRENIRLFALCINSILKDIETKDLTNAELTRCYDGAWSLSLKLLNISTIINSKEFKNLIKEKILEKQFLIGELMDGIIEINQFSNEIVNELS